MEKIRIVLADDQNLITQSLKVVLEIQADDLIVVGTAHDGREVIDLVEQTAPSVVLMDIRMPNLNGVEATRIIHSRFPNTKIIMLTTFDDDELVRDAIDAGAAGYLLKDISTDELIASIRAVTHDVILVSTTVASKLVHQAEHQTITSTLPPWYRNLTDREKELLYFIKQGFSNKEISAKLFLAEQTVKNYLSILYSKLGIDNRHQARKLIQDLDLN